MPEYGEQTIIGNNIRPEYYAKGKFECVDMIQVMCGKSGVLDFEIGNVIKYIWRYEDKNGVEDLKKARTYLDMAISKMEE